MASYFSVVSVDKMLEQTINADAANQHLILWHCRHQQTLV